MRNFNPQSNAFLNRALNISRKILLSIIAILLMLFIAIQTEFVQNRIVRYATNRISKELGTDVRIKNVSFSLFNRMNLDGIFVADQQKDTLLYAGQLKVRITDWFFFKDQAVLKYIGLEDAVVKLNRKDSVWNYKFLVNYFSSSKPKKKKKPGGLEFNLKKVDLKNIRFIQNDLWVGERMDVKLGSLLMDAENMNFNKSIFNINEIAIDKPFFTIQELDALRPDSLRKRYHPAIKDTSMYFNTGDITVHVGQIKIKDGQLWIEANEDKPINLFDGEHIRLSKLNGALSNVSFIKDTIRASVDLAVKDRCGFELKKLKTKFRFTPEIMELSALDLETNKSKLGPYYAMKYKDFNEDFGSYISNVLMVAHFKESKVHSDDIAFFAPELKSWNKQITLNGSFQGTVENFNVKNLNARGGVGSTLNGSLSMKGLPNINNTVINFSQGTLQTNYYDLGIIPALKNITAPNLPALGNIIYRGDFKGTINNFITDGFFSTALGGVKTNVTMQFPKKGDPVYTGNIETNRFNIGKFLEVDQMGMVDFKGKISGSSFNINRLKTELDGKIASLDFNKYVYSNIITKGTFQKKYFSGEVKIDDPNLDFTSDIEIDYNKAQPSYNIVGDLVHSNLKALNLYQDTIEVTGLLDANFTGTNIDNFMGSAKFLNAIIKGNNSFVNFDSLNLSSSNIDSVKSLTLGSNDFYASIIGKFRIMDLPSSIQSFLGHYFPAYIKPPKAIPQNQSFQVTVTTNYIEPYLKLFNKKISGFNDVNIIGSIDTKKNILGINVDLPYGKYNKFIVSDAQIKGNGNKDTLHISGDISSIQVSDSIHFPNSHFDVTSANDHSVVSVKANVENTFNNASLLADVYTLQDGARIQFRPSTFVLNEKKWNIDKGGELVIRNNFIDAKKIHFTQGFQELLVETQEEDGGNTNNLVVKLKNVFLGDITAVLFKNPRLEGVSTGDIVLSDFFGKFKANAQLTTEQFRLDEDSVGLVKLKAGYDYAKGEILFTVQSPNEAYRLTAKGSYNVKDSLGSPLNTDIILENSKIDILHRFIGDLFSDITGQAKGHLNISGNPNSPDLFGDISLRKAGLTVNYTKVHYTIDSAEVKFEKDGIDFGELNIQDKYKNNATVKGKLYEKGFKNLAFDFDMTTKQLLLIDTKLKDNQQFYGKAVGKVQMSFKGPEDNAQMNITAEATDSSHIFLPNSTSKEIGAADFIVFKQYGKEMESVKPSSNFNLAVDLDLTANNKVMIDVILDDLTGDVIKAVGNGRLRIHAGTTDPLTIRGRYNIDKGNYDFNFQSFIRKPFVLLPDAGNYIEWNGDPLKAEMHIDAQYTAERISLSELVGNYNFSGAVKAYRGDVYVIAQLRDKLNLPSIKFKLDFPQGSPIKTDNEFVAFLNRIEKDENEILKQVSFLIVLGSFAPTGNNAANPVANPYMFTSLGVNTISQVLTKELNKAVSNILYKITGDKSLRFDLGTSIYSSNSLLDASSGISANTNKLDRTRVNLKLGYAFANNNIVVTLGSDLDFNLGSSTTFQNGNFQWLPDFNIEFILTKDRKLRAIVFTKNSLDISGSTFGRRNRQGVSISYRKDFDKLFATKKEEFDMNVPNDNTKGSEN